MIKIAFFGTGDFSKNILSKLFSDFNSEIDISLIVSQPDKPIGRNKEITYTPIKEFSTEHKLNILQPEKLKNNVVFIDYLKTLNLDFIVVVAYGKIISKEILSIPKYGCINMHGSILPNYRGASPIQESLKNGDKNTGLTIMYMSEGMDEGDILNVEKIDIDISDKTQDIFSKFEKIGPSLLVSTLKEIINGSVKSLAQNNFNATYCKKIDKIDGKIDFKNQTVTQIYNMFRAYNIWPGIYTYYKGKKFDIKDCFFEEKNIVFDKELILGSVIEYNENIAILCNGGLLILNKIKLEGKKEMSIKDFINGNKDFLLYNFL